MTVQTIPEISKMTPAQQIELMEALWKSMTERNLNEPPDWHREYLADRQRAVAEGEDSFINLDELEDELRSEVKLPPQ
ncbi:MAG: addiction module protein [Acidobacteria bacterium]|nr:addiction module protein [Acidobacteriota bacterium]